MTRTLALLALGIAFAVIVAFFFVASRTSSGAPDARRLVSDGAWLVDVRTPAEFAEGHISGAINIPVDELDGRLTELEPVDRPVVVYCRSGQRSARAADTLRAAGWMEVHDLGSMSAW